MTALGGEAVTAAASEAVPRPELFARLERGVEGRLTIVTGAPGSGKTMLLKSWLASRPRRGSVVWMSMESADAEPARFWATLVDSLARVTRRALCGLPDPAEGGFEAALGAACDTLAVAVVVVLDDFEQLHAPRITESLDRFLRCSQDRIRLVIASRRDPGLCLQRLRLAGQLAELRSADLAFTPEQARELFERAGLGLADEQVRQLHERTEGWVGGLRLAALSLHEHPDPDAFVCSFAGDERTIADYLVEEVLHRQPRAVREFMLCTSVVEELEPDLANALTRRADGAYMLELLERSNAFVTALDGRRVRYRYHPMFLELLRSQLRYRMPDAFALQQRRAARWYAGRRRPAEAVRHALAAGDLAAGGDLLSEHWLALIASGHAGQLVEWIDGLAHSVIAGSAELAIAGAGAALYLGDPEKAHGYMALADARSGAVPAKRRARYGLSRMIVTMLDARIRGDYVATHSAARKVLAGHQHGGLPGDTRAVAHLNLGVAGCWRLDPDGIAELEEALELARYASCEYVVLDCLSQLALFKALAGALGDAAALGRDAVELARRRGWDEHPVGAPAHVALAVVDLNRAELATGAEQLRRSLRTIPAGHARATVCLIRLLQAQMTARSDVGEAMRIAHAIGADADDWNLPPVLGASARFYEATFAAHAGLHERARATLEREQLAHRAPVEHAIVAGRLALAAGRPGDAADHLQSRRTRDARAIHPSTRIEAVALAAVCRHQLHDDDSALSLVEEALKLAQPEGYRLPLLSVGPPLRELLRRRIRAGTAHRGLAGELVERLAADQPAAGPRAPRPLLDPLSEREEAVLRYLPTVMSKAEIASELYVSVNTVKTHTKNVYRKLGVGTRNDAVRRARTLGLV